MAKKSQRRPLRYDKDQAGCIWGFISFFDFRHGRLSRKLISDRSRFTRQMVGSGCSTPTQQIAANSYRNAQEIDDGEERDDIVADTTGTSVKKLMEEEMFVEKDYKDQTTNSDINTRESELEHEQLRKKRRRKRKTSKTFGDVQSEVYGTQKNSSETTSQHNSKDITFRKANLEIVAKDIWQQINQKSTVVVKDGFNNEIDSPAEQKTQVVDKKLSEAIRLFVDRRSKDGKINYSKEFMDALETLSSNKELILELLKDPNSVLVKHIEKLEDSHLEKDGNTNMVDKSKLLNGDLNNFKRWHSFFGRRSKSEERIRLTGDDNSRSPNRIVILKPGLPFQSPDVQGNGLPNERIGSHFSFTEIKRRLKHAMGKEKTGLPMNDMAHKKYERKTSGNSVKGLDGEKGGWNSPNRNHFYIEKFARPTDGVRNKDTLFKPKGSETTIGNESMENNEKRISNMYIEAKKHLSEILSQGDEIGDLSNRQSPKALGKMLSLPGFNLSPLNSPRENENRFITAKQRLTPNSSLIAVNENTSKRTPEIDGVLFEKSSDVLDEFDHNFVEEESSSSAASEKNPGDDVTIQTTDAMNKVEILQKTGDLLKHETKVDVPGEECNTPAIEDNQVGVLVEACEEEETMLNSQESFEQHEHLLSSPSTSPPRSLIAKHIENVDTGNERLEGPSPVSVLESFSTDDDISPANIKKFQPVEPPIRPLRIQFDEPVTNQEIYASACLNDEESAFEYVEAVLLASDLNINEFRERWISSNPILDPSLFNDVELFSSRSSQDQKLLFDCTNKVLEEACDGYFGYYPRVSFVKHIVRSIPRGMDLIHEIWNGVEPHLLEEHSPRTLDHIVKKALRKDGKWMDLRLDVESIGLEIGDSIFEELVKELLLSFPEEDHKVDSPMISETSIEIE